LDSGLTHATRSPVQTRFPYGFASRLNLAACDNSLTHYAKGTQSQKPESSAPTVRRHTVSGSFHPPFGVLFTFPSRYWFTIGHLVVFSLGRWSSQIPTGLLVPHGTQVFNHEVVVVSGTGVSPSMPDLSRSFPYDVDFLLRVGSATPTVESYNLLPATPAGLHW
jgi:hypothetical protein